MNWQLDLFVRRSFTLLFLAAACLAAAPSAGDGLVGDSAAEPQAMVINNDPQLFVDDYLVDNRWGIQSLTETVQRVFHQPRKDARNPVIPEDGGYLNVVREEGTGLFRMWYQAYWDISLTPRNYTYATAYAESTDGIHWKLPRIGKHMFKGTRDNNIVMLGPSGGVAECQFLLDLPKEQRRGYQYVMLYGTNDRGQRGLHLIGSRDGLEWDPASDVRIAPDFNPDTQNAIVWDPQRSKYVFFGRATNIFGGNGDRRKVARMENVKLWEAWPIFPENILLPDSLDAQTQHNYFYGMPVRYYAGIYWGFLWPYRSQEDIYTELAFSRDGRNFQRFPERPRLIDLGPAKSWDGGMVLASPCWVEVGDEWWIYYSGNNGPHKSNEGKSRIGLAHMRKEGFASLRSPAGGGFVVTRLLRWPGGKLYVNADAGQGELTVRVTDYRRRPIAQFDPDPSLPIAGDGVRHAVKWNKGEIGNLKGRDIRLEFFMKNVVDLYGFRAVPEGEKP